MAHPVTPKQEDALRTSLHEAFVQQRLLSAGSTGADFDPSTLPDFATCRQNMVQTLSSVEGQLALSQSLRIREGSQGMFYVNNKAGVVLAQRLGTINTRGHILAAAGEVARMQRVGRGVVAHSLRQAFRRLAVVGLETPGLLKIEGNTLIDNNIRNVLRGRPLILQQGPAPASPRDTQLAVTTSLGERFRDLLNAGGEGVA